MPPKIKAAVISLTASPDKEANLIRAKKYIERAANEGANWVLLPEMWPFKGKAGQEFKHAEADGGPLFQDMARTARNLKIVLFAGTWPERPHHRARKLFNTSYVFGRDGELIAKYRKVHLFCLKNDRGKLLHDETKTYAPGSQLVTTEIDGFNVGLSICYDLRFPAFFERLCASGTCHVIVVPSAFTRQTGKAHWEILLRARAVEQQCYVLAPNLTGKHAGGKASFGHAMIVDPWGKILCDTGRKEGFVMAEIVKSAITAARKKLPVFKAHRNMLYR